MGGTAAYLVRFACTRLRSRRICSRSSRLSFSFFRGALGCCIATKKGEKERERAARGGGRQAVQARRGPSGSRTSGFSCCSSPVMMKRAMLEQSSLRPLYGNGKPLLAVISKASWGAAASS
eukprot:scaffold495_cov243-Pinguiococcus_pyrenoidosus.AAC.41